MDPFNDMVVPFWKNTTPPKCTRIALVKLKLVKLDSFLVVDVGLFKRNKKKYKGTTCCWRNIIRKQQDVEEYDENADYAVELVHT